METLRDFAEELTKAFAASADHLDNDQRSQTCFQLMLFSEVQEEFQQVQQENEKLKKQNKNLKEQKKRMEGQLADKEKSLKELEVDYPQLKENIDNNVQQGKSTECTKATIIELQTKIGHLESMHAEIKNTFTSLQQEREKLIQGKLEIEKQATALETVEKPTVPYLVGPCRSADKSTC